MNSRVTSTIAACLVLCLPLLAQVGATPPARVVGLTGNLSLKRAQQAAMPLALQDTVNIGDELTTDQHSEATIRTSSGATVHIFPDSRVLFQEPSGNFRDFLHLFFGSVKIQIQKMERPPNPHQMTTPTAVIAVRGTTFSVFVDDSDATMVAVDEGVVSVANIRSPGSEILLQRGQRTWVRGALPPSRAQKFRGASEHADMMPDRGNGNAMGRQNSMQKGMKKGMDSMPGASGPRGLAIGNPHVMH
ncbi:MAG: FecR family protein [Acidobacteria bacterium]|nr:FecR family protein [Acidobacteriota bacterium]